MVVVAVVLMVVGKEVRHANLFAESSLWHLIMLSSNRIIPSINLSNRLSEKLDTLSGNSCTRQDGGLPFSPDRKQSDDFVHSCLRIMVTVASVSQIVNLSTLKDKYLVCKLIFPLVLFREKEHF